MLVSSREFLIMPGMSEQLAFMDQIFLGNNLSKWATALVVLGCCYFGLRLARKIIMARLKQKEVKTNSVKQLVFELIDRTKSFFFLSIGLLIVIHLLEMPSGVLGVIRSALILLLLLQVWFWGREAIDFAIARLIVRDQHLRSADGAVEGTAPALKFIGHFVLLTLIVLLALDNFGFNVTALLTGLGVGGIAIALAVQNILGDLFASLSIIFDKPFRVGDNIRVGDVQGSVEKIGLKTTRLRSVNGEQVVVSNNDLLQSRIQNFKQMEERRVLMTLGVLYETSTEKLKKIESLVRDAVEGTREARLERIHFASFGESALNFELSYYILSPDYTKFMDVQQFVNFRILERFRQEGIEFAYPTRTLFMKKEVA